MEERRGTLTAVPSPQEAVNDNVKRARQWEECHRGHRIGIAGPREGFTATDAAGDVLASAADLGQLMDQLDEQQSIADEDDLRVLRYKYGHKLQVTYDAGRWDDERWDARPLRNLGRDGEKITAATAQVLEHRIAAAGVEPGREGRGEGV